MNTDTGRQDTSTAYCARGASHRGTLAIMFIHSIFIIVCQLFLSLGADAASLGMPEKFIYDLRWAGIKAGRASLEVSNAGDRVKIRSTAQSAAWVSVFYTVDDRVESTLLRRSSESALLASQYRLKIREGRHRRDKEVIFDHDKGTALYIDHLKNEKKSFAVDPPVFDPLSGFFYLRSLPLTIGKPVFISVFDSKRVWNVEVQVLKKELIVLPSGKVNTILVKPFMQSEGIFSRKGEILIWLTDDEKRIPVRMQTKVAIGSITATLVQGLY